MHFSLIYLNTTVYTQYIIGLDVHVWVMVRF